MPVEALVADGVVVISNSIVKAFGLVEGDKQQFDLPVIESNYAFAR